MRGGWGVRVKRVQGEANGEANQGCKGGARGCKGTVLRAQRVRVRVRVRVSVRGRFGFGLVVRRTACTACAARAAQCCQ